MNNELKKSWDELVIDAKGGCGALLEHNDVAIIAADELIKEQQAEIEHYKNQLDRVCEDGNTPADFDKLRDANLALAMESYQQQAHIERLRTLLTRVMSCDELIFDSDVVLAVDSELKDDIEDMLSETPQQSLDTVKREWQVDEMYLIVADVAHIGVDMGDCCFYLTEQHMDKARAILDKRERNND